jgi:hypothetical protein
VAQGEFAPPQYAPYRVLLRVRLLHKRFNRLPNRRRSRHLRASADRGAVPRVSGTGARWQRAKSPRTMICGVKTAVGRPCHGDVSRSPNGFRHCLLPVTLRIRTRRIQLLSAVRSSSGWAAHSRRAQVGGRCLAALAGAGVRIAGPVRLSRVGSGPGSILCSCAC